MLAVHESESNEEHLLGHASSAKSEAECTKNTCACEQADDACPRTSCPLCSPTKFQFHFDREATLVVQPGCRSGLETTTHGHASLRISLDNADHAKHTRSSLDLENSSVSAEPAILRQVLKSELYVRQSIVASPYQIDSDGKPLSFAVILKSILFPGQYRTNQVKDNPPSLFSMSPSHLETVPHLPVSSPSLRHLLASSTITTL